MNYSSLTILSRCPQAPVPNLGQYDHQFISQSSTPSVPGEGQVDPSHVEESSDTHHRADLSPTSVTPAGIHTNFTAPRSMYPPGTVFPVAASSISPAAGPQDPVISASVMADDEFDDFKTAPSFAQTSNDGHSYDTVSGSLQIFLLAK